MTLGRHVAVFEALELHRVEGRDLQRLQEAFRLGIVIRIAAPAHGAEEPIGSEQLAIRLGGILGAAIGMMHITWQKLGSRDRRSQCRQRQVRVDGAADGVADDAVSR